MMSSSYYCRLIKNCNLKFRFIFCKLCTGCFTIYVQVVNKFYYYHYYLIMSCVGAPFNMKTQSKPKRFEEKMIGHLLETT